MGQLDFEELRTFVNDNIIRFHENRLSVLKKKKLTDVLKKKNPYLFRAKDILVGGDLVKDILGAYLYSSEEKLFGDFLEELAIFVAGKVHDGKKSTATGIDLEFDESGKRFLVSVKSGLNWGNSSQHKKQSQDFKKAVQTLRQSRSVEAVEPILGICYGKLKTKLHKEGYTRVVGQSFWHLLSGSVSLYTDIIEPLGYRAKEHNEEFEQERARILNSFTKEFLVLFCDNGIIDWSKLVKFNSGNMDI